MQDDFDKEKRRMDIWWKNRRRIAWISFLVLLFLTIIPYFLLFLNVNIEKVRYFFDTSMFVLGGIVLSYFGFSTLEEIRLKKQDVKNNKENMNYE